MDLTEILENFNPHTWENGEEGGTPITAEQLNTIEQFLSALRGVGLQNRGMVTSALDVATQAANGGEEAKSAAAIAQAKAEEALGAAERAQDFVLDAASQSSVTDMATDMETFRLDIYARVNALDDLGGPPEL